MNQQSIRQELEELNKKVDKIQQDITQDVSVINTHPVMFVVLLVGFFITMDFWSVAAHSTIHHFYPRGYLKYWEYILLAMGSLALLLWLGNKSGIRIRMLGDEHSL